MQQVQEHHSAQAALPGVEDLQLHHGPDVVVLLKNLVELGIQLVFIGVSVSIPNITPRPRLPGDNLPLIRINIINIPISAPPFSIQLDDCLLPFGPIHLHHLLRPPSIHSALSLVLAFNHIRGFIPYDTILELRSLHRLVELALLDVERVHQHHRVGDMEQILPEGKVVAEVHPFDLVVYEVRVDELELGEEDDVIEYVEENGSDVAKESDQ